MNESPYWLDTVEPRAIADSQRPSSTPSARALPTQIDVAVIGGGYTGLSAARRLAKAGASVVVFEREAIGFGASSRNGGQVLTGLRVDPGSLVARYGEPRARALFDASTASIAHLERVIDEESIECDYQVTGHLQAAWKPRHFDAFRDEQALLARVFDHHVELVPRSEQRREIGSDRYHGVLVDRRSRALNPARYVHGLAAATVRAGAMLAPKTPVLQLERSGPRWRVVSTAGETSAADVMLATNGYTDGVVPALQRGFVPLGSYIVATEPLAAETARELLPTGRMAFDSKNFLYYFRLSAERRLLFGGRVEFSAPGPDGARRAAAVLRSGLIDVFPQLAGVRIDYAWSGNVAFTRDEMPHAGRLDGMYFAGGYCGHGIAFATALGDLVARRIAGEPVEHPLLDDELPAVPFPRVRPWLLRAAGAYYQVRDWIS